MKLDYSAVFVQMNLIIEIDSTTKMLEIYHKSSVKLIFFIMFFFSSKDCFYDRIFMDMIIFTINR